MLFAPYLNNNGKIVDNDPSEKAIGYDVGLTDGGQYSMLFNIDLPVLKGQEVNHLLDQNSIETEKLKVQLKIIQTDLQQSVGSLYFDALGKQATVENNKKNAALFK